MAQRPNVSDNSILIIAYDDRFSFESIVVIEFPEREIVPSLDWNGLGQIH